MINFPSRKELQELKAFKEPFCLTVYAPFIDPNTPANPNRIELKNLLREAQTALLSAGASTAHVRKTLRPALQLVESQQLRPLRHKSIVLFMHPKMFRYYYIPDETMPYQLTVERGFDVEPLLKSLEDNKQYFVLTLSHKNVRLYKGDRYELTPIRLKNFPTSLKEALNIDEYPQSRETHTIAPASSGKGSEAFHEQYNVRQTDKAMLLEFFIRIDRRLHRLLVRQSRPLIIAGVKYLLPIYRKINTYTDLLGEAIIGNHERANLKTIREKAWRLVEQSQP